MAPWSPRLAWTSTSSAPLIGQHDGRQVDADVGAGGEVGGGLAAGAPAQRHRAVEAELVVVLVIAGLVRGHRAVPPLLDAETCYISKMM